MNRQQPIIISLVAVLYLSLLVAGMFSRDHGILISMQLKHQCERMGEEINLLKQDNETMRREWARLQSDDRYLEKLEPYKLLYIATGNISNKALLQLFTNNLERIIGALETGFVVELTQTSIITID